MKEQGQKLAAVAGTILAIEPAMWIAHFGGPGVIAGLAAGAVAYLVTDEIQKAMPVASVEGEHSSSTEPREKKSATGNPSFARRLLEGKSMREQYDDFDGENELAAPLRRLSGMFLFSEVLKAFTPTLDRIYLGTLENGEMVFCKSEDLCHVALAGSTGGGKSNMMRMLMVQLCKAGAQVLLLNPHYTGYILDKKEDWTPFVPFLADDPMVCAEDYGLIKDHVRNIAEEIIPKRLKLWRQSQPIGKPIFLVLDELPAIVKRIPETPDYLDTILKEGRKVGVTLISASQDFLVKTIGGSGAVRDCYRTCMYVGGDAQTARVLLGEVPSNDEALGGGTIVLRNASVCKKPALASVPLVDNKALYSLLGPSTYVATSHDGESLLAPRTDVLQAIPETPRVSGYEAHRQRLASRKRPVYSTREQVPTSTPEKTELERALEAYDAGNTTIDALGAALDVKPWKARQLYAQVKPLRK